MTVSFELDGQEFTACRTPRAGFREPFDPDQLRRMVKAMGEHGRLTLSEVCEQMPPR